MYDGEMCGMFVIQACIYQVVHVSGGKSVIEGGMCVLLFLCVFVCACVHVCAHECSSVHPAVDTSLSWGPMYCMCTCVRLKEGEKKEES